MNTIPAPGAFDAGSPVGDTLEPIGFMLEVGGARSEVMLDLPLLAALAHHPDPIAALSGQVGGQVKLRTGDGWLLANVQSLRLAPGASDRVIATIDFVGEGLCDPATGGLDRFRRGVTRYPIPGAEVFPVTQGELARVHAVDTRAHVAIGTVHPTRTMRAGLLVDALLARHFALLGSTGTGKSTAAALILHRICEQAPEGHVVMIDPHGEYAAAFRREGAIYDVGNLQMPYWLLNFEEHCEVLLTSTGADRQVDADILAKCLLAARTKSRVGQEIARLTVDAPVPYLLSDLTQIIAQEMGKMDRAGDTAPYLRLKGKVEELKADPRYGFMFSGLLVADTMAAFVSRVFRLPGEGKPISIIDVSGVPGEITGVVVGVLARMVLDFAIWSRDEPRRPVLLVCEEAHRYIPADENRAGSAARILGRIAKEGRKYGVALGLVTQRPSDLAPAVLSQCGTLLTMRLNNEADQAFVRAAMPESARGLLGSIPALRNRECIACGEGVAMPMRLSFDELEPHRRPASDDPAFSQLWREAGGEEAIVARTIQRWRAQGR